MKSLFRPFLYMLAGVLSLSLLTGASLSEKSVDEAQKRIIINIGEGQGKKKVTLPKGKVFWVRLKGNPTTGYLWNFSPFNDSDVVVPGAKYQYFPPDNQNGVVGASGHFEFPFETVSFGEKTIRFFYSRPWETDVKPVKEVELTVIVADGD